MKYTFNLSEKQLFNNMGEVVFFFKKNLTRQLESPVSRLVTLFRLRGGVERVGEEVEGEGSKVACLRERCKGTLE